MHCITLNLGPSCIETTSRNEYRKLLNITLEHADRGNGDLWNNIKDKFELITGFILSTDFSCLRKERPELDGRQNIEVSVSRDVSGNFIISEPL